MGMKLNLSNQESRLPLVEIPEANKQRIRALDGEFLNLYKIIGHNPTMLTGWIEFASLRRHMDTLPPPRGQAFLAKYSNQAVGAAFRELWLAALARREDWPSFRAAWSNDITSVDLRCADLNARQATGAADSQWVRDAQAIWNGPAKPFPSSCDAPFAILASKGGVTDAMRWEIGRASCRERVL